MIKEIKFLGYTAKPSDYECPDGTLAAAMNIAVEDNELRAVEAPRVKLHLPEQTSSLFTHKVSASLHNYIIIRADRLAYFTALDGTLPEHPEYSDIEIEGIADISHINAIGNTLIIFTSGGMHYLLWKGEHEGYKYLGTHLPECALSFGLQSEIVRSVGFNVEFPGEDVYYKSSGFDKEEEAVNSVTSQVLAKVNKFIAEESVNKGKFIFPFFVRYAYKLFDGSITMHSAPILMIPSTGVTPFVPFVSAESETINDEVLVRKLRDCRVAAPICSLDYAFVSDNLPQITEWSDIIKSVDIYISAPIYTYDQNGKVTRVHLGVAQDDNFDELYGVSYSKLVNKDESLTRFPDVYARRNVSDMYMMAFLPGSTEAYIPNFIPLPGKSADKVKEEIRDCGNFYFLRSIELADLSADRTLLEVSDDILQSLVARRAMTDDYDSHDTLIPKYSTVYNSRLNIANLDKKLFGGYHPQSLFPFTDGYINPHLTPNPLAGNVVNRFRVNVYIKQDGRDFVVSHDASTLGSASFGVGIAHDDNPYNPFLFFYYPNINAYKAVICPFYQGAYNIDEAIVLPLEQHTMLNGAFYFNGWDSPRRSSHSTYFGSDSAHTISLQNKIYTSEVNNPFVFPVTSINTVGTGTISAIASAAKALSQGQFGQFPLYAFTSEGVWALEISATGTFSARQPISRDVVLPATPPLQLDDSVLFATARGIMLLSGSNTQCISEPINADKPYDLSEKFPELDALQSSAFSIQPFDTFLDGCGMLYDYRQQRVIVYNKLYPYAYIYSLSSRMWGFMHSSIASGVNSYPDALAIDSEGNLVNISVDTDEPLNGFFITRPLKLDAPDVLKTVSAVVVRGYFVKGNVKTILYGSRDLIHWHVIRSSTDHNLRGFSGTPYKYFRIAVIASLSADESIFGATVQYEPRYTNKLR